MTKSHQPSSTTPAGEGASGDTGFRGERRQLTVLFCDLVQSTELSSRLDPEDYSEVIRTYQNTTTQIIADFQGYIAHYVGDGLLVYFGYPNAHESDVERAANAALKLIRSINGLKPSSLDGLQLSARVGIATGPVVIGNNVSDQEIGGMAVGETVNLAARILSVARPSEIVVAQRTKQILGRLFEFENIGVHTLKGFSESLSLWRLLGEGDAPSRFEAMRGHEKTPFTGRVKELKLVKGVWRKVLAGSGQVIEVTGEAGIGKSRLANVFLEKLSHHKAAEDEVVPRILDYSCSPMHTNTMLHPLIRSIRLHAAIGDEDTEQTKTEKLDQYLQLHFKQASKALPIISELSLGIEQTHDSKTEPLSPQFKRRLIFKTVIEQIQYLAEKTPLVIICEDLHWLDPTSIELFHRIVESITDFPVLILMTYRPEFTPPWSNNGHVHRIKLDRLAKNDATEIVKAVVQNTRVNEINDEVVEKIVDNTDGVPLYLEDITKTVLENQSGNANADSQTDITIPAGLQDALMARLGHLGQSKDVAQTAAVIGRQFSLQLLSAVLDREIQNAIDELNQADIIRPSEKVTGSYVFKHALIRDIAYDTLLRDRRKRIHDRVAAVLNAGSTAGSEPDLVAYHLEHGETPANAIPYLLASAKKCNERSAFTESLINIDKGLELLNTPSLSKQSAEIELEFQIALGAALTGSHGFANAAAGNAYQRARALCAELGDPPQVLPVLFGIISFHSMRSEFPQVKTIVEEILTKAKKDDDETALLLGYRQKGAMLCLTGNVVEARKDLLTALRYYEEKNHGKLAFVFAQDYKVSSLCFLSVTELLTGNFSASLNAIKEAVSHAKQLRHLHSLAWAMSFLCGIHMLRSDYLKLEHAAREIVELSEQNGYPTWLAMGLVSLGLALTAKGEHPAGLESLQKGLGLYKTIGASGFLPMLLSMVARGEQFAGQHNQSLATLHEAIDVVNDKGERWFEPELYRQVGEVLSLQNITKDEVAENFHKAVNIAKNQKSAFWELKSLLSLARLQDSRATEFRKNFHDVYNRMEKDTGIPEIREAKHLI